MSDNAIILHWPNGQTKRICHLQNGIRDGWDRMWNEQGILVDEGAFAQGKPVGTHRRWDQTGRLVEEVIYDQHT